MAKEWNNFMKKRSHKRGPFLYPTLKEKIKSDDLKRTFSYCATHCNGDKEKFVQMWRSFKEKWKQRDLKNATSHELQFLDEFMEKHLDDVEYFVDGQRTNLTESFQNIATKYCPKRTPYSFKHYIMRKTLAALQFNEQHSKEEKEYRFRRTIINRVLQK
jgi:hypothetical protein